MVRVAGELFADDMACITCVHVLEGATIKLVSRDSHSEWQFLCEQAVHEPFEARVIALAEAVTLVGVLADLLPFEVGEMRSI
ncbi:hypothetical protein [Sphingomonas sp.]|uniref:hypothetical protein n=1 Tax=Sphingomonas sp. TaxID=28214 RepID=UPI002869F8E2|nr:hypothetical protein [Sphingomonas sp.]